MRCSLNLVKLSALSDEIAQTALALISGHCSHIRSLGILEGNPVLLFIGDSWLALPDNKALIVELSRVAVIGLVDPVVVIGTSLHDVIIVIRHRVSIVVSVVLSLMSDVPKWVPSHLVALVFDLLPALRSHYSQRKLLIALKGVRSTILGAIPILTLVLIVL